MYPSDFNTAETVYAPVEDTLVLGVHPLLVLALLGLILAVAAGAYMMGRRQVQGEGGTDGDRAAEDIHKVILAASMAAMAASSNDLKSRAEALRTAISDHLGPVMDLAKGVNGPTKALDEALKGEVKVEPRPDAPAKEPAAGHDPKAAHDCGCGKPKACTCDDTKGTLVTVTHVRIGETAPACACKGAHKPECEETRPAAHKAEPEKKAETRAMTGPEQVEALSRAVRQFHDHWSRGPERLRELKGARAALSRRPVPSLLKPESRRVWTR